MPRAVPRRSESQLSYATEIPDRSMTGGMWHRCRPISTAHIATAADQRVTEHEMEPISQGEVEAFELASPQPGWSGREPNDAAILLE